MVIIILIWNKIHIKFVDLYYQVQLYELNGAFLFVGQDIILLKRDKMPSCPTTRQ